MVRKVSNILVIAVLVYAALLAYLYFNQRNMMYFPDTSPPNQIGPEGLETSFETAEVTTKDNLSLKGWYIPPRDKDKPVIVVFHGNAGHYGDRLDKMAGFAFNGYGLLLAGYRGYGGNPGKPSEQGLYADARAYLDWLEAKGIPGSQIVLYGESLGTGVAVQMATEREIGALVLEAPYSATSDVAQSVYFFMPVKLLMKDQYRSVDKIGQVTAPVLIVHGALDRMIPIAFGRMLFEQANEPKTFIPLASAAHNDIYDHGAQAHIHEFLDALYYTQEDNE